MSERERLARQVMAVLVGGELADLWPAEDIYQYLEADGYEWINGQWIETNRPVVDVDLIGVRD